MNNQDDYEEARKLLVARLAKRLDLLRQQQDKTRTERAWKAARNEQDSLRAPQPSGPIKAQAPGLAALVEKHEALLFVQDEQQCEGLRQEHADELQRLNEIQRQGKGHGLSKEEIAVRALAPHDQSSQRQAPMRNLPGEFNRQSLAGTVTDETRLDLETAAEKARNARLMRQVQHEIQQDGYEAAQAAALSRMLNRGVGNRNNGNGVDISNKSQDTGNEPD